MFSSSDYKSLISSDVDQTLIAIVESAYKAVFEATAATIYNPLIQFPYIEVAELLGIDLEDCRSPEGELSTKLVIRKLNEDPRFMKVDMKVSKIVRLALDICGLASTDEGGVMRHVFSTTEKSVEFRNIVENVKTALKKHLLYAYPADNADEYMAYIDSIPDDVAAKKLVHSIFGEMAYMASIQREGEPLGRAMDISIPSEITPTYAVPDENSGFNIVHRNSDGTVWASRKPGNDLERDNPDEDNEVRLYLCVPNDNGARSLVPVFKIVISDAQLTMLDYARTDAGRRRPISALTSHINWMHMEEDIRSEIMHDVTEYILDSDLTGTSLDEDSLTFISLNLTDEDLVSLIRKRDFWQSFLADSYSTSYLKFIYHYFVTFLVYAFDDGLADADDIAGWLRDAHDGDLNLNDIDPALMALASKCRFKTDEINVREMLDRDLDAIMKSITGKDVVIDTKSIGNGSAESYHQSEEYILSEAKNLRRASVQRALLAKYGFMELCNAVRKACERLDSYVPISDDIIATALFRETDPRQRTLNAANLVEYYAQALQIVSGHPWCSSDVRRSIFNDIKRNLTPRIQEMALESNSSLANSLQAMALRVPGMAICDAAAEYRLSHMRRTSGAISPINLLRAIRRAESDEDKIGFFLKACLDESIVSAVKSNAEIGKRIMREFEHLATDNNASNKLALMDYSVLHQLRDGVKSIPEYIATYIAPSWKFMTIMNSDFDQFLSGTGALDTLSHVIDTFSYMFKKDELQATNTFLNKKNGLLRCTEQVIREVPVGDGTKTQKKMVQVDSMRVRLALVKTILDSRSCQYDKADAALIGTCIAGRHLILDDYVVECNAVQYMLKLDQYYRLLGVTEDEDKEVISMHDYDTLISEKPATMLAYIKLMPEGTARRICDYCTQAGLISRMATTTGGLELLLSLAEQCDADDNDWKNFAKAFTVGNSNNIKNLLKTLPSAHAEKLMSKLGPIMKENPAEQFAAVGGAETSSGLGETVQFSMANGLRWMKGYAKTGNPQSMSPDHSAGLYSAEEAARLFATGIDGWRMPTMQEIVHLGDNPDTITEEALGFGPTGMAEPDGSLIEGSEDFCFAWCMGPDGPVGYSVDSNNVIDPADGNVQPDYLLAVKLVR